MGLFSSGKKNTDGSLNAFIGEKAEYKGKLDFQGTVRIDGHFEGEIVSQGKLILGKLAVISGTLRIGELVSSGHVTGEVYATGSITLKSTAVFQGSLSSPKLMVEDGAVIDGSISMQNAGSGMEKSVQSVSAEETAPAE